MTQQAELLRKIDKLPPQYIGEVYDFVGYLQAKAQNDYKPQKVPVFGYAKGMYNITETFFEPLEDFKDYM
ncbi:MAG: DUF2281 domain-containing protein [Treponema sp.]|jgi:hypothetical protein|nr:DUF2281 domain-containing protein [Treponema sp.]